MLQTIRKAARGFLQRVRRRGFVHACRWTRHHLYERWRERRLGIDTAGFADWKGSVSRDDCHDYAPLSYACIERALALVEIDAGSDVFLDYGCGKGRAVVVAATLPFRRVIGVDLVDALCEIARRNVKAASRHLRCQDVEIITADATTYVVPEEVSGPSNSGFANRTSDRRVGCESCICSIPIKSTPSPTAVGCAVRTTSPTSGREFAAPSTNSVTRLSQSGRTTRSNDP
jgi:SAM-dependent methyltransferase